MKLVIEARLIDDVSESTPARLATIERALTTDTLGLSLAEDKAILAGAEQYFVQASEASESNECVQQQSGIAPLSRRLARGPRRRFSYRGSVPCLAPGQTMSRGG